ncbi:PadR family transcriptional regulator [Crossiella sp. CA-258035]|uniref:PadR family transcriptional regulator n=1 Tax=Crossiella sp. CA-258035 TaxID=2981138 RepID=UPI0024BCE98B|nr:PadR family transcriptional regulator [Crossiella sp. CA-258035]WHT21820.1 PadR family transcriptional regulator [Crossiella sp. CA-258035]
MSLRHALLGMLALRPEASGYDLAKHFEGSIGRYAWSARHNQIYTELNKLADDGLVEAVAEGARGRRDYVVTEAGRAELQAWLGEGPLETVNTVRNKALLRIFLITALEPGAAQALLRAEIAHSEREIAEIGADIEKMEEVSGPGSAAFGRIAAELGRRHFAAIRDWAEWAVEQLDAQGDGDEGAAG